jgi:hypothetical protein
MTPDRVKPADVLAWVHGIGRSGRTPSGTVSQFLEHSSLAVTSVYLRRLEARRI